MSDDPHAVTALQRALGIEVLVCPKCSEVTAPLPRSLRGALAALVQRVAPACSGACHAGAGAADWRDRVPVGPGPQLGFPIPEIRDLIDLRAILLRGLDLHEVIADAERKDGGVSAATLAWLVDGIKIGVDARLPGVNAVELEAFRRDLVRRLRAEGLPPN